MGRALVFRLMFETRSDVIATETRRLWRARNRLIDVRFYACNNRFLYLLVLFPTIFSAPDPA